MHLEIVRDLHDQTINIIRYFLPILKLIILFLEVLQLFQALDLLLGEGVYALPGVVDVGPAFPLDEELGLPLIFLGVKVCPWVPVCLHSIQSCGCPGC